MAITRITGEEDVHGIENAEDVEKEISFSLLLVMSFIECEAVSTNNDEFHSIIRK